MSEILSYDETLDTDIPEPTPGFLSLRWNFKQGPLSDVIKVLADATDANSDQAPWADKDGKFHDVSELSISDPPISSIRLSVDVLDRDADADENGDNEAADEEDDSEDKGPSLEVKSSSKPFVTIGDYVAAVHPWILSLRDEYLEKRGNEINGEKLPSDTDLWFNPTSLDYIMITDSQSTKEHLDAVWRIVADYALNLLDETFPEETFDEDEE
ncbi:hypothetical protein VHEMI02375 [[Torrubiella] hemipterigena]|uniref:Uncharacterized protein n=1 Tax=[Torrubiella] hemipterigena TaxID=1531966 RepID=A0A0A1TAA5_9HYPO|nr:hypothetical protein VHEMI02375 [[Torrubiella] hemipterigena]